jgi:hypothetical protein
MAFRSPFETRRGGWVDFSELAHAQKSNLYHRPKQQGSPNCRLLHRLGDAGARAFPGQRPISGQGSGIGCTLRTAPETNVEYAA